MKNKIFFHLIVLVIIGFIVFSCTDDGPTEPSDIDRIFYGKVADEQGNPVPGVNVHYIPSLIDTGLQKIFFIEPTPSTVIRFSIPEQTYVTIVILRHSTRDTITYLVNNQLFNAGIHEINVDDESLTNGVYDYIIKYGTTLLEKSFLIQKTPEELLSATPLAITDSEGKFQLYNNEFCIGTVLGIVSEVSPEILFYKEISDTIRIVLIKNSFNNYLETIVVDTNKVLNKTFTITKP